jgi:regulatory protein
MKIISLIKKGSNIELGFDDGSKYQIDYRSVFDNGLRKNDELSDEKLNSLLQQSEFQKTKDSALRLLARRPHSKFEIKTKLVKKGFSKTIIDNVVQRLTEDRLLDDFEFSKVYASELFEKRKSGILKIKNQLIGKGVDRKSIENVLNNINGIRAEDNAYELIIKKFNYIKSRVSDPKKIQQKLYSFLLSKGYPSEIISKTLRKLNL